MLKTVKVKKNLRLDELIKYVWDNHLYPETFKSNFNDFAHFDKAGKYQLINQRGLNQATTFTVEVEEPITENTEFQTLVAADAEGDACLMYKGTIDEIRDSITTEIYANINGKLQLIWECDEE